jgi:hypothetical protein
MAIILLNLSFALIDLFKKIYLLLTKLWFTKILPYLRKRKLAAQKKQQKNEAPMQVIEQKMIDFEKHQDRFMKRVHKPTSASPVRVVTKQMKKKN